MLKSFKILCEKGQRTLKKGQELNYLSNKLKIFHQNIPGKQLNKHAHVETHLFIPLHGDIWLEYENNKVRVPKGKMLLLASNIEHSFESEDKLGERIILLTKLKTKESKLLPISNLLKELIFHLLITEKESIQKKSEQLIIDLIQECIESDIKLNGAIFQGQAKDPRLIKAIELIENDLTLSIGQVAKNVGISSKSLTRIANTELALSPKQMQTLLRIEKAQALIKSKSASITESAFEVGFNSLSAFIKNYRDITGKLPSEDL